MRNAAVVITGIKDIDRRLKSLIPRLQKKVIRQAIRDSLKRIMKPAVEAEAPVLSGETKRNVKVRAVKSRKRGSISLEVRIAGNDNLKKTNKDGTTVFYPAVVEYKWNDFMKRAFDSKGEATRKLAENLIRAGIEREASQG